MVDWRIIIQVWYSMIIIQYNTYNVYINILPRCSGWRVKQNIAAITPEGLCHGMNRCQKKVFPWWEHLKRDGKASSHLVLASTTFPICSTIQSNGLFCCWWLLVCQLPFEPQLWVTFCPCCRCCSLIFVAIRIWFCSVLLVQLDVRTSPITLWQSNIEWKMARW